jgi:NAD+ synthase (glutamine-hydrolysing)
MKVTIAQLNPIVGDIAGNQAKLINTLAQFARETDLIVFPELFLVGYPPKDLLEKPWFVKQVSRAIDEIVKLSAKYPDTGIIFGAPIPSDGNTGKGLYNSALLVYQGRILLRQAKSLLPTYDVFDEARHFDTAPRIKSIAFKEETLGITICEDAWYDPTLGQLHKMYDFDPITELAGQGATLIINISASPFHIEKDQLRFNLMHNLAKKHRIPFVITNQIGGNDELIFDGGSMCFDGGGNPIYIGPFCQECIQTVDMKKPGTQGLFIPQDKTESVCNALILGVRDYLRKCGFQKAVLGLSGGIDSALACCLAVAALGKDSVLGITMPSPYSSPGSIEDSRQLTANLGIRCEVIPISDIFQAYLATLAGFFPGKALDTTEENIQARIRGNILMAFSNKFGYLALSTGNKSEMAVGYCTLYGDMSGGLSVISDVPKTMVYELAAFINRSREIIPRAIIEKAPSAELKPGQRDQDTLPPYPILDQILHYYIEEGYSPDELMDLNFDPETVKWVVQAVDRNEYKRKQAAPGLKVTTKAFGVGRRMPVAKKINW